MYAAFISEHFLTQKSCHQRRHRRVQLRCPRVLLVRAHGAVVRGQGGGGDQERRGDGGGRDALRRQGHEAAGGGQ